MADCATLRFESSVSEGALPEAAALSAAAFRASPSYQFIYPESEGREAFLAWLFERNYWLRLGTDAIRCTYDAEGRLVAFFMFVKPGVPHPGALDMLRAGLLGGLFKFGWGVVKRLLATKSWFEKKEQDLIGDRKADMIWLERMTVLPSCQGKRVGSRALGEALKEADRRAQPCMLATQEDRNVTFYRRLGFEVVDETVLPEELGGYRNWFMIREPEPAG